MEETNFLRLVSLVLRVAPLAVRRLFDVHLPAIKLNHDLQAKRTHFEELKTRRVINPEQFNALYPANSKMFDLTLMILLLRELSGIQPPSNGWNSLPNASSNSIGDHLARIKYYRNWVTHTPKCSISLPDFNIIWDVLKNAIISLGGPSFKEHVDELKTKPLDQTTDELLEELNNIKCELQDKFPENIKYINKEKRSSWVKEGATFVPTRATGQVFKVVGETNVLMVCGRPGTGKTATVQYVALCMKNEGYNVYELISPEDIMKHWIPEGRQVFFIDNALGIYALDIVRLKTWDRCIKDLKICFKHSDLKILITVRSQVESHERVRLLASSLGIKKVFIDETDNSLTRDERGEIFEAHVRFNNRENIIQMVEEIQDIDIYCFPLLCRIFAADKESRLSKTFFENPLDVFKDEMENLRISEPGRFFCLILIVVYDNDLRSSVLKVCKDANSNNDDIKDKEIRKAFLEQCKLPTSTSRKQIEDDINALLGTFLLKENDKYRFVHDIVYNALIGCLSSDFHELILKYCSSKFVRNRIRFTRSLPLNDQKSYIILGEDFEMKWGRRILKDIEEGYWHDVFTNKYLLCEKGDQTIAEVLQKCERKDVERIMWKSKRRKSDLNINIKLDAKWNVENEIIENLNSHDSIGKITPLHWAMIKQLQHVVDKTLDAIIKFLKHDKSEPEMRLLSFACISGDKKIVQMLINHGATVNGSDSLIDFTPLYIASLFDHESIAEQLITRGANIDDLSTYGEPPLYIAAKKGLFNIVTLLTRKGANVNECEKWHGRNPLYTSSKYGHVEIVQHLLDHKAVWNVPDKHGLTPLYLAAESGQDKVVELLIQYGVDVKDDIYDFKHSTPLYAATKAGHEKVVRVLVEHGADVNKPGNYGETPLYVACDVGFEELVEVLIDNGADVNKFNVRYNKTPLYVSTMAGNEKIIRILLDHDADVNKCDKHCKLSPLLIASALGDNTVVQLLLDRGAMVNRYDKSRRTPIFVAAENGHYRAVELLLQYGADMNIQDQNGLAPLSKAKEMQNEDVAKLLIDHSNGIKAEQKVA